MLLYFAVFSAIFCGLLFFFLPHICSTPQTSTTHGLRNQKIAEAVALLFAACSSPKLSDKQQSVESKEADGLSRLSGINEIENFLLYLCASPPATEEDALDTIIWLRESLALVGVFSSVEDDSDTTEKALLRNRKEKEKHKPVEKPKPLASETRDDASGSESPVGENLGEFDKKEA